MQILLAVDGSPGSYEAARALENLATPDQLILLIAVDIPGLGYQSVWFGIEDLATIVERDMREEGERLLARVASLLPTDVETISKRVERGKPAEVILDVGKDSEADLIVLGARGLNPLSELVFGSVSHRVMTHATCSTFVVKDAIRRFQHILLPIEGYEDTKTTMTFLEKKPFRGQPHLTVLHAVPFAEPLWLEGAMVPQSYRQELMAAGEQLINQVVSQLSSLGYKATPRLKVGSPSEVILKDISETKPDLIMMGSHGRRGVSRFLLGSVSHAVVHRAPCSVLVLR